MSNANTTETATMTTATMTTADPAARDHALNTLRDMEPTFVALTDDRKLRDAFKVIARAIYANGWNATQIARMAAQAADPHGPDVVK